MKIHMYVILFFSIACPIIALAKNNENIKQKLQKKEQKKHAKKEELRAEYDPRNPLSAHTRHAAYTLEMQQHPQTKQVQKKLSSTNQVKLNKHLTHHSNHENLSF